MKEYPIIFSPEMVLAILEGRKTQTRRIIPIDLMQCQIPDDDPEFFLQHCRYGHPGDHLWVREKAKLRSVGPGTEYSLHYAGGDTIYDYRGDANHRPYKFNKWTPSIHMPRWASRLTLENLNVRVQCLQAITDEDVLREGIRTGSDGSYLAPLAGFPDFPWQTPRLAFAALWNSIHGPNSWDINPWVWAITFKEII